MKLFYYLVKRILGGLPLLILLPLLTFLLMHFVPGNYFDTLRINPQISPETVQKYEALYHLDQPVWMQYLHWLKNLCRLDLGYSFAYKQPVLYILGSRLMNTFLLTSVSFALAWMAAVLLGLLSGVYRNSFFDRFFSFLSYLGLAVPNFLLCLILLFGLVLWGGLPLGGMKSAGYAVLSPSGKILDVARHMILPVTVLGFSSFAYFFRVMRQQTLSVMNMDFVLYYQAQKLPKWRLIFRHIGRNSVNPMVSLLGMELPFLFSGSALVEVFSGWPGLGQMMLQAVRTQDLFLVLGNMLMISLLLVLGNLLADILLVFVDPRLRLQ